MMELRRYREGDMDALRVLRWPPSTAASPTGRRCSTPSQNARLDLEQVHVIEEDGEARASATVLPLESFVEGEPRPMGGISAVMVHPAYRRRGYAGEADARRACATCARGRSALSLLSPFAHAFYRVFGYELVTEDIEYRLKPADLSTSPEQGHLRDYREEDLPSLMELYEAEATAAYPQRAQERRTLENDAGRERRGRCRLRAGRRGGRLHPLQDLRRGKSKTRGAPSR